MEAGKGNYRARLHGSDQVIEAEALEEFERRAWNSGLYTRRMTPDEYQHYFEHPEAVDILFNQVVASTVKRWIDYAHTRLAGSEVVVLNAPGNDDPARAILTPCIGSPPGMISASAFFSSAHPLGVLARVSLPIDFHLNSRMLQSPLFIK